MAMKTATLRSTGDKLSVDPTKPVFVQGAWNLGPIYEWKEIETAGFNPGMSVDPVAAAAGQEDNVTIGATGSTLILGVAEIDFGQLINCNAAYSTGDEAPIIYFHWNPGALLNNIQMTTFAAHMEPGELIGTTSAVAGLFKDDTTTAVCLRSYKYVAKVAAMKVLAFIHGYL